MISVSVLQLNAYLTELERLTFPEFEMKSQIQLENESDICDLNRFLNQGKEAEDKKRNVEFAAVIEDAKAE